MVEVGYCGNAGEKMMSFPCCNVQDPEEQFDLYMYEGSELEKQSNNENEGTGHVT